MDDRRRRKLTFFTIGLIFLLSGVEYAVILPTIWRYLQTLDAAPYFLGLALSAFSLSGLLTGPLFGHWSDRTGTTKKIILFANFFEIAGNFMYFMGFSKWLLLSSRLVAGIGTGAGSSIFGFLTRSTAPDDRATVFAAVMACRQAGLLIGPAFNIFLRLCDFHLGPFVVNKYTAPGLFMCLLWILLQMAVVFMYWDLPPLERAKAKESSICQSREEEESEQGLVEEDNDEEKPLMASQELAGSYGSVVTSSHTPAASNTTLNHISPPPSPVPPESNESSSPFKNFNISREFLREEVVVLLAAQFITLFNQTALETMVTPMTQKYFSYGELENSVMYCLCGVEVIAGFLFVRWLSRRVAERVVLAIGLTICNISGVWCLIFLANPLGDDGTAGPANDDAGFLIRPTGCTRYRGARGRLGPQWLIQQMVDAIKVDIKVHNGRFPVLHLTAHSFTFCTGTSMQGDNTNQQHTPHHILSAYLKLGLVSFACKD